MTDRGKALTVILEGCGLHKNCASLPDGDARWEVVQAWIAAEFPGSSVTKAYARELLTRAIEQLDIGNWTEAERWVQRAFIAWMW